jgi:ribokinase
LSKGFWISGVKGIKTLKPIVVVGSINLDFVVRTRVFPRPGETVHGTSFRTFAGGKGANQAVAVAKLGYPVAIIGKLGQDAHGEELLEELIVAGVDCMRIGRSASSSSGAAFIVTDQAGENTIVVVGGANQELRPEDIVAHEELMGHAGMILLQLEIPLATVEVTLNLALEYHLPVMLDPAPPQPLPRSILEKVAWLTPNETEAHIMLDCKRDDDPEKDGRRCAEQLLSLGPRNVVVKLGAQGSYLATGDGVRKMIPAAKVAAIDSTAAGDAYNAAFAVGLLEGKSPSDAAYFASIAAAISVTREGALRSLATRDEVSDFMILRKGQIQ